MKKAVCLDWMSFTAPKIDDRTFPLLPPWESGITGKPDVPRFGYRSARKFPSGMTVMYDGATSTMGWHYIYSGSAIKMLDEVFEDGGQHILNWHISQGHKCTRIDLAIDVYDAPSLLPVLQDMAEHHEWYGTAHSATTIKSSDGKGLTIYVGSRTSERFVRIYNKAAQTGQRGDWTRIECEVKGDSARQVARAIVGLDIGGISMVAYGVIERVCRFPTSSWEAVFDGAKMEIGTPQVEEKQTEAWILGQVASAVARFEREYPDKKILERLWNAIEDKLGE
jgi:DNA relaxase NicK